MTSSQSNNSSEVAATTCMYNRPNGPKNNIVKIFNEKYLNNQATVHWFDATRRNGGG